MKRSGMAAAWTIAMVLVGCGGGGGTNEPRDEGTTTQDGWEAIDPSDTEGESEDATDVPGADSGVDPTQEGPNEPETSLIDLQTSDGISSDEVAGQEVIGQDPGVDTTVPGKFRVRVFREDTRSEEPVPIMGASVVLLDNETGQPTGMSGQTDEKGEVVFELAPGTVFGLKVSKDEYITKYFFDIVEAWGWMDVWMFSLATIEAVSQMIGLTWNPAKGLVEGRVVFGTGSDEEDVGCAVIETAPVGDVRYWDPKTGMPTTLDKAPMTSKANASFVVGNLAPGSVRIWAKVGQIEVGKKDTFVYAGGMTSITVLAKGETNPTPADCKY